MSGIDELRRAFDEDMRRATPPARPGIRIESEPRVRRTIGEGDAGWYSVDWTDLDEQTADAVIAREVSIFGAHGRPFEWKYFDYDRPADLEQRLLAAGFVAGEAESVMIGEIASLPRFAPPDGIDIVRATDAAGVDRLIDVHDAAFGTEHAHFRATLLGQLEKEPDAVVLVLAVAGGRAVSAARLEMIPGTRFASLWGGGTLAEWRGRGIYRALVSYRADIAAARGYRYLHVDASSQSRPILERLGFVRIARTTPYVCGPS